MDRNQCLQALDEVLELPPGTIQESQSLEGLENWDSITIMSFMALADERFGVRIQPRQIAQCRTAADLIGLFGTSVTS
jgi:acyl carrier protein